MVGQVAGRVLDHPHADVPDLLGAPPRVAGFSRVLGPRHRGPVGDAERHVLDSHHTPPFSLPRQRGDVRRRRPAAPADDARAGGHHARACPRRTPPASGGRRRGRPRVPGCRRSPASSSGRSVTCRKAATTRAKSAVVMCVPQLAPTMSAPASIDAAAACSGDTPIIVRMLPFGTRSKAIEATTNGAPAARAARIAMSSSSIALIVSMMMPSAPPVEQGAAPAAVNSASSSVSGSTSPSGRRKPPHGPMSPSTQTAAPAALRAPRAPPRG